MARTCRPDAERFASPVFSGKDEQGTPIRGDHGHAFYLPTDEDGDGRLDHLTVFAQGGFPRDEVRALDAFRWLKCGDLELSLLLVGLGQQDRVPPCSDVRRGQHLGLGNAVPRHAASSSAVARNATHANFSRRPAAGCLCQTRTPRGAGVRGLGAEGVEIETLEAVDAPGRPRPVEFCLRRRKPGDDGENRPRGLFRLRFPAPVSGPIALGHSCHFGLGLFLPDA